MKRMMLICLLVLCLLPLGGWAETSDVEWFTGTDEVYNSRGEHFFYEIKDDHAILTAYCVDSGCAQPAQVRMPESVNGFPLTVVGFDAFNNWTGAYDGNGVECIILPEGVTELETNAFECAHGVKHIEFPSTLEKLPTGYPFFHVSAEISFPNGNPFFKIEDGFLIDTRTDALIYCNPSSQALPLPRVRRIEDSALSNYDHQLETLEFPDSVEYIGSYNDFVCLTLKKIIVPGSVIELADHALCTCLAEEIILNEGLQKIGSEAFAEVPYTKLTVPSTVTWIGYEAFGYLDPEADNLIVLNPDVHWETEEEYNARFPDNSIDQKTISVGDTVTFGNYAQDNDQSNGKEPIEWIVLDVQDGKALLLSKYGLSAAGYHNTWDDCTWETCSLRTWLNDRFLNWAFSLEEQAAILTTTVDNSDPQGYDWTLIGGEKMPGGNNTQDRIFLLSCAEANRYLNVTIEDANNVNARVAPTAYAITLGVNTSDEYRTADGDVTGWWWLRSPGSCPNSAAGVNHDGSLSYSRAYHRNFIVRPALWIDLNYVDF